MECILRIPSCTCIPLPFSWFHGEEQTRGEQYGASVSIVSLVAAVELLAEPLYVLFSLRLEYGVRSFAEGAGMIARCIVQLLLILYKGNVSLESFAWGFVAYSTTILIVYAAANMLRASEHSVLAPAIAWTPSPPGLGIFFGLARSLSFQSLWKVLLAQGAKVAMAHFQSRPATTRRLRPG